MDTNFSLGGREFRLSKLDPFKQFHVVRRVGPVLGDVIPAVVETLKGANVKAIADVESLSEDTKMEVVGKFASPVITGFSKLNDEDSEYVLLTLLSVVEVKQSTGWAKISNGSIMMINDFEMAQMLSIAGRAFMFNLSGFFAGLPQK
jgi:hypothetical protein